MSSTVAISCWFGIGFSKPRKINSFRSFIDLIKYHIKSILPSSLYHTLNIQTVVPKAPKNCQKALFFTNNSRLKKDIENKGWEYFFMPTGSIDGINSIDSSLEAKRVKFLQFEDKVLERLKSFHYILYMDSRAIVDDVEYLKKKCDRGIVIRYSPAHKNKLTVWDEVREANNVDRYRSAMPQTIKFINDHLKSIEYSEENRIMATGVILYKMSDLYKQKRIFDLCSQVYATCMKLKQPECQIIWCILSQPFSDLITAIEAEEVGTRSV